MPLRRSLRRLASVAAPIALALACNDSPTGPVASVPEGVIQLSDTLFTRGAVVRAAVRPPEGFVVVPASVTWTVLGGEAALAKLGGNDDSVDVGLTGGGSLRLRARYTLRAIGVGSSLSSSLPSRRPSSDVGVVGERGLVVALPALDFNAVPAASNTAGVPLATVRVVITDVRGRIITTATDSVTLAIDPASGAPGATLLGSLRVRPVAGIATFTGLSIRKAGVGYRLIASSPSLPTRDTTLVTIVAAAPDAAQSSFVLADLELGEGQTTTVTITLRDQYGNLVTTGTAASFVPAASRGSFGTFTCLNGVCTGTYTAPASTGPASVGASIGGTTIGGGTPAAVTVVDRTPPVITGPSGGAGAATAQATVEENTTAVDTLTSNEPVTWRISGGSDGAKFVIDAATGALRFVTAPDFAAPGDSDGNNTYVVTVEARDAAGNLSTQTITVSVVDLTPPVITGPSGGAGATTSAIAVSERTTVVDTLAADESVTWRINGGTDAAKFAIDSTTGVLRFLVAPTFGAPTDGDRNNTYLVTVEARDASGNVSTQRVTVTVVDRTPPVITGPSGGAGATTSAAAIPERTTAVHTLTANETVTWRISGGADAAKFAIQAGTGALRFLVAPLFGTPTDSDRNNTYVVTVEARDAAGNLSTQTVTVTILDRTRPVITGPSGGAGSAASEASVEENTTAVYAFTANETVTWRISAGTDAAKFAIDPVTGAMRFTAAPDFEAPTDGDRNNVYLVTVEARDAAGNLSTQTVRVRVTNVTEGGGGGGGALVVGPTLAEKLPGGTQLFTVTGGTGPYTWQVNGVAGGNATFGTITAGGLFTAPSTVPAPATYQVCVTDANGETGCATMTISGVPSAGGDLIVINDINWGDIGLGYSGFGTPKRRPGNQKFLQNVVGYTTSGSRNTAKKVWFWNEGNNAGSGYMPLTKFDSVAAVITAAGYTVESKKAHSDLTAIPSDVKVIFLVMPGTEFAKEEYNALKSFAQQGGRIVYVGENGGFYAYGLALENTFIQKLGGVMTNTGGCEAVGVIVTPGSHQLTTGIGTTETDGFFMACVSPLNLGPNDYAIFRNPGNNKVMVGVAKIDFTPIP